MIVETRFRQTDLVNDLDKHTQKSRMDGTYCNTGLQSCITTQDFSPV